MKKILPILFLIISTSSYSQFGIPIKIDSNLHSAFRNMITFDVNNDGRMDIVVMEYVNIISWYENTDTGFSSPQNITSSIFRPYHFDKADVNGDGFMDLLVTNNAGNSSGASVFLNNNGGISWTELIIDNTLELGSFKSFFIDVENDGDSDIVIISDSKITLYKNNGNGGFSSAIIIEDTNQFYSLIVGDFNTNGFTDLIISTAKSELSILTNNTSGSFNPPLSIDNGLRSFLTSTDIDNDGDLDLIGNHPNMTNEVQFYKNNGTGTFTLSHNEPNCDVLSGSDSKFRFSDLNNNGYKDILYLDNFKALWKENDESGSFGTPILIDSTYKYRIISSADVDNDGDNDIIWLGLVTTTNTYDFGYIKNESPLGLKNIHHENEIKIFPNPASNRVSIRIQQPGTLTVYNTLGQVVLSDITLIKGENNFEFSLSPQLYYFTVQSNSTTKLWRKLISIQ